MLNIDSEETQLLLSQSIIFDYLFNLYKFTTNDTRKLIQTIVSSIGYVVLSGNIHVERDDTTFLTPVLNDSLRTLSFISMLVRCKIQNSIYL